MMRFSASLALLILLNSEYCQADDYKITVHSGVILPFKPITHTPWDGFGGQIKNAKAIVQGMTMYLDGGAVMATLGGEVLEAASAGSAAPDCYVIINWRGRKYGKRGNFEKNEYLGGEFS